MQTQHALIGRRVRPSADGHERSRAQMTQFGMGTKRSP
jgi:hypothetical protein